MQNPRAIKVLQSTLQKNKQMHMLLFCHQANKQMCFKKYFIFLSSFSSNISGPKQNIKNLVGNLLGKG